MPFTVIPLRDAPPIRTGYNKSVPQPSEGGGSFRCAVVGQSGSGKTVVIINLMRQWRRYMKKICVWSPNLTQFKRHFGKYLTRHDVLYEGFSEAQVRHHFEKAVARNRKHPRKHTPTLFVLDDCIEALQKCDYLMKFVLLTARKESVNICLSFHKWSFTTPLLRQNLSHAILLSSNDLELRLVAAYLQVDAKELIRVYRESGAHKRFSFIYAIFNPASVFLNFSDKKLLS